jgi:hypothetical protein
MTPILDADTGGGCVHATVSARSSSSSPAQVSIARTKPRKVVHKSTIFLDITK